MQNARDCPITARARAPGRELSVVQVAELGTPATARSPGTASTPAPRPPSTTTTAAELQVRDHREHDELGDNQVRPPPRDRRPAPSPRPSWGAGHATTTTSAATITAATASERRALSLARR
jgi:hypothetical protein